jgi:hypothetical protein
MTEIEIVQWHPGTEITKKQSESLEKIRRNLLLMCARETRHGENTWAIKGYRHGIWVDLLCTIDRNGEIVMCGFTSSSKFRPNEDATPFVNDNMSDQYGTSSRVLAAINRFWFDYEFDHDSGTATIALDPFSSAEHNKNVNAFRYFDVADDGLSQPWIPHEKFRGRVHTIFINMPYGKREILGKKVSMAKAVTNYAIDEFWRMRNELGVQSEIIMLMNCSTASPYQQALLKKFPCCFVSPREKFVHPLTMEVQSGNRYDQIIVGMTGREGKFKDVFSELGAVV